MRLSARAVSCAATPPPAAGAEAAGAEAAGAAGGGGGGFDGAVIDAAAGAGGAAGGAGGGGGAKILGAARLAFSSCLVTETPSETNTSAGTSFRFRRSTGYVYLPTARSGWLGEYSVR